MCTSSLHYEIKSADEKKFSNLFLDIQLKLNVIQPVCFISRGFSFDVNKSKSKRVDILLSCAYVKVQ